MSERECRGFSVVGASPMVASSVMAVGVGGAESSCSMVLECASLLGVLV